MLHSIRSAGSTMKIRMVLAVVSIVLLLPGVIFADFIGDLLKKLDAASISSSDDKTVVSGLKEALSIGTASAVKLVARENGYFGNQAIKILMPEKLQIIGDVMRNAGFEREVDEFTLSMNRAAEKAAPKAKAVFVNAIREMTFQDARKILHGGDTAATDYFREKTSPYLAKAFKPEISSSMDDVGVTRQYKSLTKRYLSLIPFATMETFDLDQYVTNKALEGLFLMIGQEERKIRTDPAKRTTELLKKVFGKEQR